VEAIPKRRASIAEGKPTDRRASVEALHGSVLTAITGDNPPFSHSEDYRNVTVRGENYTLTPRQAQMVQILHEARENGIPELSVALILEKLDTPNSRWQDTWRGSPDARKALIRNLHIRKGFLRLNV
jgi:hypothetical protein